MFFVLWTLRKSRKPAQTDANQTWMWILFRMPILCQPFTFLLPLPSHTGDVLVSLLALALLPRAGTTLPHLFNIDTVRRWYSSTSTFNTLRTSTSATTARLPHPAEPSHRK